MPVKRGRWRTLAKLWCAAVLSGIVFLCWATTGNPERHSITAMLQYLPYPLYLAPAGLALVLSLGLGWGWRLLAGASVTLALTVLMGLTWGSPDEGHGHVRFMTYNAKTMYAAARRNGLGELAQEIMEHDPDVLVMQDSNQMGFIKESNPEVFRTIVGKRKVFMMGQYLVASRLPLKDCRTGLIPFRDNLHTYLHCVLQAHGKEVDLVTVHFLTPRLGLNAVRHEGMEGLDDWRGNMLDRLSQSRQLAADLGRMTRSRIVAGDLNAPERSTVVQMLLQTGLRDAWSSASKGYGYTHGHSLKLGIPLLRIDHVLVSDDIGVARAYVGGHEASEHSPVIADLRMHRD
jgi:vancomycin resistance protein VanJ